MALVCIRLFVRQRFPQNCRNYSKPSSVPKRRETKSDKPVFQYIGQNKKPNDKVFVWGFSYTGALGIPSFVVPDSGRKRPRKYQLTPYRLDTAEKVGKPPLTVFLFCMYIVANLF